MNSSSRYIDRLSELWEQRSDDDGPTVISTFSGAGGSTLGYEMAGFNELLAVEWDDNAVANLKHNFDIPVYHGDIADLRADDVCKRAGIEPGELDLFDGSPPCQGFSALGKEEVDDERNELYLEYSRLLRELQPKTFVAENVKGMVRGSMKAVFADMLRELRSCGYSVSAKVLNAKYLEVPQNRPRLIFVGVRDDLPYSPVHPEPQTEPISIREALAGVSPSEYCEYKPGEWRHKVWKVCYPGHNLSDYETDFSASGSGYSQAKPDPNGPISTITKSSGYSKCTKMHWKEPRSLAIEELQVLQSFPTEYELLGSFREKWARIGNSVPPLMMFHIARRIREECLV
ncbi:DNA cytosine methyltransferase [Halocatena halophila]|uniref:DNA cytosine methyltransferase n=1 Tax=Halocatena halophila TaxID=2814576 RepID=UPI002ED1BA22